MEMIETMMKPDKRICLPQARLPGRHYEDDKPWDCRYCYYWAGRIRGCQLKNCWYLIHLPEQPKQEFDENGVPILNCKTCAYGKNGPCIGYCIAKIQREIFSKTRGWKLPARSEPAVNTGLKMEMETAPT